MISPDAVANEILRKVVAFVKNGDRLQLLALHTFPVAIYVTDIDGFITYFNAANAFATPQPKSRARQYGLHFSAVVIFSPKNFQVLPSNLARRNALKVE